MSQREDKEFPRGRRKHRRVATREVTAEVRAEGAVFSYSVLNISTGGALVGGDRSPPIGSAIEIELRHPGAEPIALTGRVAHERREEGIGLCFDPVAPAAAAAIERLITAVDTRASAAPPPLPAGRGHRDEALPAPAPRPGPDPFADAPDPRPPRAGSPDERLEYLRALLKKRDEALSRGRAAVAGVIAEADGLRELSARLKSNLEEASARAAGAEAALEAAAKEAKERAATAAAERTSALEAASREAKARSAAVEAERTAHREAMQQEMRRTLDAIAAGAGLEAKLRRQDKDVAAAREEAVAARREAAEVLADAQTLRRSREELVAANRKAMEAQAQLNKERAARVTLEADLAVSRAGQRAAEAEGSKATAEAARLKAKLVAAENALERSAARRAADPGL
ncbi:MAG: PilZ domain-containing protein, partial [Myxococcaceae bacterium]